MILDCLGVQCNHKILIRGRRGGQRQERLADAVRLTSKVEKGAKSQGMWVARRRRKRQRSGDPPETPEGMELCPHLERSLAALCRTGADF